MIAVSIETQKENIQSLASGRSAKSLAQIFSPVSIISPLSHTQNLNDAIRAEYEKELLTIDDSDDPLDIYDRYVKWTLNTYPTAQATPGRIREPRAVRRKQFSGAGRNPGARPPPPLLTGNVRVEWARVGDAKRT